MSSYEKKELVNKENTNNNSVKLQHYTFEEFKELTLQYGSIFFKASNSDYNNPVFDEEMGKELEEENTNKNISTEGLKENYEFSIGKYKLISLLYQGFFGKMFVAEAPSKDNSKLDKCMLKVQKKTEQSIGQIAKEWEALKRVAAAGKNSFVVKFLHCCQTSGHSIFCMELLEGGSLREMVVWQGCLEEAVSRFFTACLIIALRHLHSLLIAHGDLKLQNVVLDGRGFPKLVDFGHCSLLSGSDEDDVIKTACAKDYVKLARCLYEMLTGDALRRVPMVERMHEDSMDHFSTHCIHYLLLTTNEVLLRERFGAKTTSLSHSLIKHPFFQGIEWKKILQKRATPPSVETRQRIRKEGGGGVHSEWNELKGCEGGVVLMSGKGEIAERVVCVQKIF